MRLYTLEQVCIAPVHMHLHCPTDSQFNGYRVVNDLLNWHKIAEYDRRRRKAHGHSPRSDDNS